MHSVEIADIWFHTHTTQTNGGPDCPIKVACSRVHLGLPLNGIRGQVRILNKLEAKNTCVDMEAKDPS